MNHVKTYAPFILAALLGYGIAYFIHRCPEVGPMPPADLEADRLRVMRELRAAEVQPLLDSLTAKRAVIDSLRALQPKVVTRWREVAVTNWELPDNEAAAVLMKRINERMP
jgi:hypothetical protein